VSSGGWDDTFDMCQFHPTIPPDALLFATFVQQDTPDARATGAAVEHVHVRIVRRVLMLASRRCRP
jgi:hypothetical protein